MFEYVAGKLTGKKPTQAVVDVKGIGFRILIPTSTYEQLPEPGAQVRLMVVQHVREDTFQLYGFMTGGERTLFELMVSVPGVGPRTALAALSTMKPTELQRHLTESNPAMLQRISGVGRKTAERLIVELRDRTRPLVLEDGESPDTADVRHDALLALEALGYARAKAEMSLRRVLRKHPDASTADQLIRLVLSQR